MSRPIRIGLIAEGEAELEASVPLFRNYKITSNRSFYPKLRSI